MTLPRMELSRENIMAAVCPALEKMRIPCRPGTHGQAVEIDFNYGERDYDTRVRLEALTDDTLYVTSYVPLFLPEEARLPVLFFLNEINRRIHFCAVGINLATGLVEVRMCRMLTEVPDVAEVAASLRMVCDLIYTLTDPIAELAGSGWDLPWALEYWYGRVNKVRHLRAGPAADAVFVPLRSGDYLPKYDPIMMTLEIHPGRHACECGAAAGVRPGDN